MRKDFCWRVLCGCSSQTKKTEISRKKTVVRTHILQELNVTVAMATEFEALDTAVRYLNEAERPHEQLAVLLGTHCVVCSVLLCLELKEDYKTFGVLVIPNQSENYVVLFIVLLCSCYRIRLWSCGQENDRE